MTKKYGVPAEVKPEETTNGDEPGKYHFEEDITNNPDWSSLNDEQAADMGEFMRSGLAFLNDLGEKAERDHEITGFTPTQGGVLFEHDPQEGDTTPHERPDESDAAGGRPEPGPTQGGDG